MRHHVRHVLTGKKNSSRRQLKPGYDPLETQRTSHRLFYCRLSENDSDPPFASRQCSY